MTPEEEFRSMVMQFVDVCDKIESMSKLRKEKTELSKRILEFMKLNDIAQCNLRDGGKLVLRTSKSVSPLKKDYICDQLTQQLGKDVAEQLTTRLWTNRSVATKDALKRVKRGDDPDEATT